VKENVRTGQVELEVSDDPEDCIELDVEEIPITVTLTKVLTADIPTMVLINVRSATNISWMRHWKKSFVLDVA